MTLTTRSLITHARRVFITVAGLSTIPMAVAAPALGEPVEHPCDLAITILCSFVPMAPHLEGDVDFTQQLPPADPGLPPPESLPPNDPCSMGCA